jgi:hypothetical protein
MLKGTIITVLSVEIIEGWVKILIPAVQMEGYQNHLGEEVDHLHCKFREFNIF